MSQWHRHHPELAGTDADPWMQHESYRKALPRILTEDDLVDLEWERENYEEIDEDARARIEPERYDPNGDGAYPDDPPEQTVKWDR